MGWGLAARGRLFLLAAGAAGGVALLPDSRRGLEGILAVPELLSGGGGSDVELSDRVPSRAQQLSRMAGSSRDKPFDLLIIVSVEQTHKNDKITFFYKNLEQALFCARHIASFYVNCAWPVKQAPTFFFPARTRFQSARSLIRTIHNQDVTRNNPNMLASSIVQG